MGVIMSIDVSEKLKLMRESERLNRREVSDLTGVPYSSLSSYESRSKNAGVESIMKILQHPRFTKYTMWFMTDQIAPEAGQIAPALAHFGQQTTTSPHSDQKTG
jgi:transcriptional regulator with XRE-family HTH domain